MPVKTAVQKNWSAWIRGSDGVLRSDDPYGAYGGYTPTLPTTYIDTTYSLPTGNTWTATNTSSSSVAGTGTGNRTGCSFLYAWNNCARGDVIILTAGATYSFASSFTIPSLSGSGWVYVISSAVASLPAYGEATANRVAPADAANMAKLVITTAVPAFVTTTTSKYFRFVGLEITSTAYVQDALFRTGNGETSLENLPSYITLDRCYIHAESTGIPVGAEHYNRRGVAMNGASISVVSCYISGFSDLDIDSQGIYGYNGGGPYKIVNNYIEAASENLMFGGQDGTISGQIPSDIEIRHNYFKKPTAWFGTTNIAIKNLIEFKCAQRVLVEGNTFENCWPEDQNGFFFLITPRNQDGAASWSGVKDITIRLNKAINVGCGFNIAGQDDQGPSNTTFLTQRILIQNNVLEVSLYGSAVGTVFQILNGSSGTPLTAAPSYVSILHNTCVITAAGGRAGYNALYNKGTNLKVQNNIFTNGTATPNGWGGDTYASGTDTLNGHWASYIWSYNVLIAGSGTYPNAGTTYFPANNAAVGFTNFAGGDYTLTGASTYHNAASDGTDMGADVAAVNAAIA